ncbi:hypothetical protein BCR43DRAFT_443302 [Syncephalastrum racemosum]|uniref:CsbD-like domain-containing protein n=1 Tax=Syncephalastrum racemosum TaxID=13706 RepID=A0A1X2H683_SYNRA|nr:hypothetical protein BCR43DRAFT_443302 [Syncephalastrum racemosum]
MASSSNAVEPSDGGSDPQVQQWTSAFWRNTGRVQSALGEWTGLESWRNAGQSTEQWAEQNYADAKARAEAGQASRLHGEYERMMGMLGTAMGHVAGDPEMEAKARLRARQGQEEIDETRR